MVTRLKYFPSRGFTSDTHRLVIRCPHSRSPAMRCRVGTVTASRPRSPRWTRSPLRPCWTRNTCRSPVRSWGKTSTRSAAVRAPGCARNAPPPVGTATSPLLYALQCPEAIRGSGFCWIPLGQNPNRRILFHRLAAPVYMSYYTRVGSRAV